MQSVFNEEAGAMLTAFVKRPADLLLQALPALKGIAEDAIFIGNLVREFKANSAAWSDFGKFVQAVVARVLQSINTSHVLPLIQEGGNSNNAPALAQGVSKDGSRPEEATKFVENLTVLHGSLVDIRQKVEKMRGQRVWRRATLFYQDPTLIQEMRRALDEVLQEFQLGAITHIGLNLDTVVDDVRKNLQYSQELNANVNQVKANIIQQGQNVALDRLPYTPQASWDETKVCLPDTRKGLLNDIESWVGRRGPESPSTAEILVLTGVVGAGKSTIMHTIAQRCANNQSLASAFFFDRGVEGRNNPSGLFTTVAGDLCRFDQELATQIAATAEKDRGLMSSTLSRKFEELIFKPLATYTGDKPLVIVIDALDEGISNRREEGEVLLNIFRERIPSLPPTIRIVLAYRAQPSIDAFFRDQPHIRLLPIDTRASANLEDIGRFIRHELAKVASRACLGDEWPGEQTIEQLTEQTEGLFQWAAMACAHLNNSVSPDRALKQLISNPALSGVSSEAKMNRLYDTTLDSLPWNNPVFANGYSLVMGTIVAAKTPLSSSAMHSLHRQSPVPIDTILQQISPFTTGWNTLDRSQPIQIVHQSLREHITSPSDETQRFSLSEKQWSQELALPCLNILNQQLDASTPGTGYVWGTKTFEIPKFDRSRVSEEFLYAAQFWVDHLLDCEAPVPAGLAMALRTFFSLNLVLWMEVVSVYGQYRGIKKVIEWIKANLPHRTGIVKHVLDPRVAQSLRTLSQHLTHMDRPEEALNALQDSVELYQQLDPNTQPENLDADLARSKRLLSTQLAEAGREDEAVSAADTALAIDRQLASENPEKYTSQLAATLDTYATVMSRAGKHAESLPHIQEAVELYRQLATKEPGKYDNDLARCLNNLAAHLGRMGRHEEALPMIHDALSTYRCLAQEHPETHTDDLANCLSNLYAFLSGAGRHAEALPHIQESVSLYRQLVAERPAAYTDDLAKCLSNLAAGLSNLERGDEALPFMREAIELLRGLHAERPTAHHNALATGLFNLSSHLNKHRQYREAMRVTEEAIEYYRPLADRNPSTYKVTLATLFVRLYRNYLEFDQDEDALAAILEAVRLFREAKDAGDADISHQAMLAGALNSLSNSFAKMGMEDECLEPASEAVQILRELSYIDPENVSTRYTLGQGLLSLTMHLNRADKPFEAHTLASEAVEIYQALAGVLPTEYTDDLAGAYGALAYSLNKLGRAEEAMAAGIEALALYKALAEERPAEFGKSVLEAYVTVIKCMIDLGDQATVMQMTGELVSTYQQIMRTNPGTIDTRLAALFNQLANAGQQIGLGQIAGIGA